MSKNQTLEIGTSSPSMGSVNLADRRYPRTIRRRLNPWHLLGWLRRTLKNHTNREFYSHAEKRRHQHAKMAQRASTHYHGFKF